MINRSFSQFTPLDDNTQTLFDQGRGLTTQMEYVKPPITACLRLHILELGGQYPHQVFPQLLVHSLQLGYLVFQSSHLLMETGVVLDQKLLLLHQLGDHLLLLDNLLLSLFGGVFGLEGLFFLVIPRCKWLHQTFKSLHQHSILFFLIIWQI